MAASSKRVPTLFWLNESGRQAGTDAVGVVPVVEAGPDQQPPIGAHAVKIEVEQLIKCQAAAPAAVGPGCLCHGREAPAGDLGAPAGQRVTARL